MLGCWSQMYHFRFSSNWSHLLLVSGRTMTICIWKQQMKSHPASNLCWSSWTSCPRQSWRGVGEEELWSGSGDPLETRDGGDHDSAQTQRTLICQHPHHHHHDHHQKQSKVSQIINYQQLSSLWWWTTSCGDYNKEPWYNRCRASTTSFVI